MKRKSTTAAPAEDALGGYLCFAVYSAGLAFNRVYKPILDRLGLTYLQYLAVVILRARDEQTVGELGEQLFLDSSTLTPLIKRLEAAGLVTRRRDSVDERVVRVSLTDKGRAVAEEARCVPAEVLAATGRTPEQLAILERAIVQLRDAMRANVGAD